MRRRRRQGGCVVERSRLFPKTASAPAMPGCCRREFAAWRNLQRWKPGDVPGVSRCLLRTRAGIKLAQATCREQRAIAFALSLWHVAMRAQHAAADARLRYAIERVDYGNGIAVARELLAQLHRGWHQPGRHGAPPTLEADLGPLRGSCRSTVPPKCLSDLRLRIVGMCQLDNRKAACARKLASATGSARF